jgi:hypothetical protein
MRHRRKNSPEYSRMILERKKEDDFTEKLNNN